MPFDNLPVSGTVFSTPPLTLAATVQHLGIAPVPHQILLAHKISQLHKYPGNWWFHHTALGSIFVVISFFVSILFASGCLISAMMSVHAGDYDVALILAVLGGAAAIIVNGILIPIALSKKLKGPAIWIEHTGIGMLTTVPSSMAGLVWQIKTLLPRVIIVVGELRQESVSLDPYLLVRYGIEEIVIGIWDDETGVLYEAGMI